MFIISKNGQRGAILRDYEFIDGEGWGKSGLNKDKIKVNGITFGEYDCPEDYEDARSDLLTAIKSHEERYQLK